MLLAEAAGPNPIEIGLMAVTLLLTIAAVFFGVRALRRMNDDTDTPAKP